ncbi:hypothetical protein [Micromonospora sp. CPCC 206061]|uniref:hypothetical protein n=1 Tax=Micromonospora sp. CPCC 206061 TaxID=3122410 RepID=UPI002FEEE800
MRGSRLVRLGVAVAAGVLAVGPGGPARAADTININPGNVPTPAAGFDSQDCGPNFGEGPHPGEDIWVFVLPKPNQLGSFTSVTATFDTPDGEEILTIPTDGGAIVDDKGTSKAWIRTPAGWTLTAASADITGTAGENDEFNLTRTCPTGFVPKTTPPVTPSGAPDTGGGGQQTSSVALGAGALVLAGAAGIGLIAVARRRRADG